MYIYIYIKSISTIRILSLYCYYSNNFFSSFHLFTIDSYVSMSIYHLLFESSIKLSYYCHDKHLVTVNHHRSSIDLQNTINFQRRHLSIFQSVNIINLIYLSHLPILSIYLIYLIYLTVNLIYLSIYLSISLSISSIYLPINLIYLSIYLSVNLSNCQFHLSIYLIVNLSNCQFHLSIYLSI